VEAQQQVQTFLGLQEEVLQERSFLPLVLVAEQLQVHLFYQQDALVLPFYPLFSLDPI
jgi:hypothetical protein